MEPVTFEQLSEKALAATVFLETVDSKGLPLGCGCGFLVRPNQIVTSFHVIEGAAKATAKLVGKSTPHPLYERNGLVNLTVPEFSPYFLRFDIEGIIAADKKNNLVILAATELCSQPLPLGDSDAVRIDESVYVVDKPKNLEGALSRGIISGITENDTERHIQVKATISPRGNGGAVLNGEGKVIGVSCMMLEDGQPLNLAIPSNALKTLLTQSDTAKPFSQGKQAVSAETYFRRGDANYAMGQHQEAIAAYDAAIRLQPDFANAYNNRGLAKEKLGQHQAAITDYSRAIEIDPRLASAYNNRGNAKRKLEQYFAAIADLDTAIQLKPDYARAYVNRGSAKSRLGHPTAASEDFDIAISLAPELAEAYHSRGVTKASQMQPADAIEDFTAAIQRDAEFPNAYYSRGVAHFIMGQIQAAKSDLQTVLELVEQTGDVPLKSSAEAALALIEEKQTGTSNDSALQEAPRTVEDIIGVIKEKSAGGDYIFRGERESYGEVVSGLYREFIAVGSENFNIADLQTEFVDAAREYTDKTEDFEILTELHYYGGKTNLIDFTTDYHVALFFACYGSPGADGRVIVLQKTEAVKEIVKSPRNQEPRVNTQKSVFVQPPKGYLEQEYEVVQIPKNLKLAMLRYLRSDLDYEISPRIIYNNDIHGFIYQNAFRMAYREFYAGLTAEDKANASETPEKRAAYEEAIKHYTNALKQDLQLAEVYNNRGITYCKIDEYDKALDDFNTAIELNPDDFIAYNNRGNVYRRKGEINNAIGDFNTALTLKPDYAEAYHNRSNVYSNEGSFDRALKDLNKAIELDSRFAAAYNSRGSVYHKTGELEKAIADFNKAIELNPDYANAYYNRGNLYGKAGDVGKAIEDLSKAIKLKPDYADAYYDRGVAYGKNRAFDRAIADYTKAIELSSDNTNKAYCNRGAAYFCTGEFDLAIEDYTTALGINPHDTLVYFNRALVWLCLQNWDKAKEDLVAAEIRGLDVSELFHTLYKSVADFERIIDAKLPADIKAMLAPQ